MIDVFTHDNRPIINKKIANQANDQICIFEVKRLRKDNA